jgi:hypothetical protein
VAFSTYVGNLKTGKVSAMGKKTATCAVHTDTELVCPKCLAAKGGETTAEKHAEKLSGWGKLGGRPRKKKA